VTQLYMYNGRPTAGTSNKSCMASPLWAYRRRKVRKTAKASRRANRGRG